MKYIELESIEINTEDKIITALKCVYYVANNQENYSKGEKFVFDDIECSLNESLEIVKKIILNKIEEQEKKYE